MLLLFLKHVFILLHIITAAAWFGMGLRLATQARKVVQEDLAIAIALAEDTQRTVRIMGLFVVLTLVFSYTTFFLGSPYGPVYHVAMTLMLLLVAVQFLLIQPGWRKLRLAVEEGTETGPYRKRVAIGMGLGQLLWLILLILMFWNRLSGALA